MKNLLLISMLAGAVAVQAQPVITHANMPASGDSVRIAICSDPVAAGSAGAGQTWDMSALTETQEQYFKFMPPAQSPWGYLFTNADICGKSWDNSHTYYKHSAGALEQVGHGFLLAGQTPPNDTVKSVYTNTDIFFQLPLSFGDTSADTYSGTDYALGFSVAFTGTIGTKADGYGTLILPNHTYTDVLRYHFTDVKTNMSTTVTKEQWGWISPGHRFWLLIMETVNDGTGTSTTVWYSKQPYTTVGISDAKPLQLAVAPNPVRAGQQIGFAWQRSEPADIRIISSQGQVVLHAEQVLKAGSNRLDIPPHTCTGLYFLEIRTAGQVGR